MLNKLWEVGAKHALYSESGNWYHQLKEFPGALFDANGYIVFMSREDYLGCENLRITKDLNIPSGISSIPGYVRVTEKNQIQKLSHQIKEVSGKGSQSYTAKQKSSKIETPKASDLAVSNAPERILSQTYRIIRDTKIACWVKYIHGYKCQICGTAIELGDGELYAEAHHIKPLGKPHCGPDVVENIICVCPNHHAQLDYGAIRLNKAMLTLVSGHNIDDEYIDYYNEIMLKCVTGYR